MSTGARDPISELLTRLDHPDPAVRKIAAMDLVPLASSPRARAALWNLYADPRTPAPVAHAAILAHDAAIPPAEDANPAKTPGLRYTRGAASGGPHWGGP